ncbi:MAG: c-type cytochrome [Archangium sp.]
MSWLALTLVVTLGAEPDSVKLARGKVLFAQRCSVCHGEGGAGDGVTAKALKPPPANLTAARFDASYLEQVMFNGVPGTTMPAQQDLTPVDRAALIAFVTSLAPAAPSVAKEEVVSFGRDVFEIRCAACHGVGASGNGVSRTRFTRPPADFTRKQPTTERIVQVLENGIPGTAMTPMKRLLSAKEVDAVVAYLQSAYGTGAAVGVPPR